MTALRQGVVAALSLSGLTACAVYPPAAAAIVLPSEVPWAVVSVPSGCLMERTVFQPGSKGSKTTVSILSAADSTKLLLVQDGAVHRPGVADDVGLRAGGKLWSGGEVIGVTVSGRAGWTFKFPPAFLSAAASEMPMSVVVGDRAGPSITMDGGAKAAERVRTCLANR